MVISPPVLGGGAGSLRSAHMEQEVGGRTNRKYNVIKTSEQEEVLYNKILTTENTLTTIKHKTE